MKNTFESRNIGGRTVRLVMFITAIVNMVNAAAPLVMTELQKQQVLAVFNLARRTTNPQASNMKMLKWDENLALEAQAFTDVCQPDGATSGIPLKNGKFAYWDHQHRPDPVGIAKWRTLRMAPFYDYEGDKCIDTPQSLEICRHPENYRNLVQAKRERVGCSMTDCRSYDPAARRGFFFACIVDSGTPSSIPAWASGKPCSACQTGWDYCADGLCSKDPFTSRPSQAPSTTKPSKSPTRFPSKSPVSSRPTKSPTKRTKGPTRAPVPLPTKKPTRTPVRAPTKKQG